MPGECLVGRAEDFRCFFAEQRFPFVQTPTFVLNSAMDYFQTSCILAGRVRSSGCVPIPGWEACRLNLNNCSDQQMSQMIAFERDFITAFRKSAERAIATSGAFLYSCHNHVAGDSELFNRVAVAGQTMSDALREWWADSAGAAREHSNTKTALVNSFADPCVWYPSGAERRCNPTCYRQGLDSNGGTF